MLWYCHDQLVAFAISISKAENGLNQMKSEVSDRFGNVVLYSGIGLVLFNIVSSIKHFMQYKNILASDHLKYCYLLVLALQVFVVFVFMDIVLQNWQGDNVSISNFSMRYQAIGGMVGVTVLVVQKFFVRSG